MAFVPITPTPFGTLGGLGGAGHSLGGGFVPPAPAQQPNFFQSEGFSNALQALGMSLMSSPRGAPLSGFAPALRQFEDQSFREKQMAQVEADRAKTEKRENATIEMLKQQHPDLAGLYASDPSGVVAEVIRRQNPQGDLTANMRDYQFAQQDPAYADFIGAGPDAPAAPSGYQRTTEGNLTYIPGGPADPSNATLKPPTEAERRNKQLGSVIGPELETVNANWDELSNGGNQGWNAMPNGAGFGLTSPGYQQATSALSTIAQNYLYSVSGAAAPAEEVDKLVQSVTPRPFESAQSIADKKARVEQMAAAVRQAGSGSGGQAPASPAGSNAGWEVLGVE